MSLVINTNVSSMISQHNLFNAGSSIAKSMERLASGVRLNHASDDAAGLSLSNKLKTQINGTSQASQNAQAGISMIQTADGALDVVQSILQRGRELALQAANGVYAQSEREAIQLEVKKLMEEIDGIAQSTKFSDKSLLDGSIGQALTAFQKSVIASLKSGWLDDAEDKIQTYYGLMPSNFDMKLYFDEDMASGASAYVSYSKYGNGDLASLSLHINESDFKPNTGVSGDNAISGGPAGMYNDMILAHELTHAVIADQIKGQVPIWFNEGCAEFLVGRDNQLKTVTNGNNPADVAALVEEAAQLVTDENWNGTGAYFNYSVGYFATKFLNQKLQDNGSSLADVFTDLKAGSTLEQAIANHTPYATKADLTAAIRADGVAYYNTLDFTGGIFTQEADTGSVQGLDNGGAAIAAQDVIQAIGFNDNPTNFNIIYPEGTNTLDLQVGANIGDENTLGIQGLNSTIDYLGLGNVDVTTDARGVVDKIDAAIEKISQQRSKIGATSNKLTSVLDSLSVRSENFQATDSQIKDTDMAKETANLTKAQILQKATMSVLSQANQSSSLVLNLLS